MWMQPKVRPFQESDFFTDGQSARPLVPGTVARHVDESGATVGKLGNEFYTGIDPNSKTLLDTLPPEIAKEPLAATLHRGQERFNIYCAPCHGRLGDGKGMIAQRGFQLRKPVGNYHTARLRRMPLGHYYDVITHGFGAMYSYAARVEPDDRWRIAAYIRVLQHSQNVKASEVPAEEQKNLDANALPPPAPTGTTASTQPAANLESAPSGPLDQMHAPEGMNR
jgi:mono/diheme cytochrome c family protein